MPLDKPKKWNEVSLITIIIGRYVFIIGIREEGSIPSKRIKNSSYKTC